MLGKVFFKLKLKKMREQICGEDDSMTEISVSELI